MSVLTTSSKMNKTGSQMLVRPLSAKKLAICFPGVLLMWKVESITVRSVDFLKEGMAVWSAYG